MALTYNGIKVPTEINPKYIFSAFANPIDELKLEKYIDDMQEEFDIEYTFPPILGYPVIIDEEIIEKEQEYLNGEIIEKDDIGKIGWYVTDGHHRVLATNAVGKKYINVEIDRGCITDDNELKKYDDFYK